MRNILGTVGRAFNTLRQGVQDFRTSCQTTQAAYMAMNIARIHGMQADHARDFGLFTILNQPKGCGADEKGVTLFYRGKPVLEYSSSPLSAPSPQPLQRWVAPNLKAWLPELEQEHNKAELLERSRKPLDHYSYTG